MSIEYSFPASAFWFLYAFLIAAHLFLWLHCSQGFKFYFRYGFAIIAVANFLLGIVIFFLTFPTGTNTDLCYAAVGYCSTMSCIAGNIYYQGYVFMFVIFCFNASIGLQALAAGGDTIDYRLCPNCKALLKSFCVNLWRNILITILRAGLLFTTFTGILPTIAYDDASYSMLLETISNLHLIGVGLGCGLVLFGLTVRTIWRIYCDIRSCCHGGNQSEKEEQQQPWLGRLEIVLDIVLLVICLAMIATYYDQSKKTSDAQGLHLCILYEDVIQCNATDREPSVRKDWPCYWNSSFSHVHACSEPNCKWTENSKSVIAEFYVFSYVILFLASYLSSIDGPFSYKKKEEMEDDKEQNLGTNE